MQRVKSFTFRGLCLKIGIIGSGQLAQMLAESLSKFGADFLILSRPIETNLKSIFHNKITDDPDFFQQSCEYFLVENEFLDKTQLEKLLKEKSQNLFPKLEDYQIFQNKISQRKYFDQLKIKSPKWTELNINHRFAELSEKFNLPFVLKLSAHGYDGNGVRIIKNLEDFNFALKDFNFPNSSILIEEKIKIKFEVAQGFVANSPQNYSLLPLVNTVQIDGICKYVTYPAQLTIDLQETIQNYLKAMINSGLKGIFNFEFFVDESDNVIINEGAPRPHNSQHLTINASDYSQFDLVSLAVLNRSLPRNIITQPSGMLNLLGKSNRQNYSLHIPPIDEHRLELYPKLYFKFPCRPGRKMGHINVVSKNTLQENEMRPFLEKLDQGYYI